MFEKEIIDAGYKTLAKKHHPDKGGRAEDFRALQTGRGNLVAILAMYEDSCGNPGDPAKPMPRVVYPPSGPPPIVPGSRHTVDDVIDLAAQIVNAFNPKPKRKRGRSAVGR